MNKEETIQYLVDTGISPEHTMEIVEAIEQEQAQDQWIPVSERYPTDTNKCYLVCYEDGCITIEYLYFNDDEEPFFSEMELGVVAWMPLPEPYKSEVDE